MRLCSEAGCARAAVSRGRCRTHAREADRRHHQGEHRKLYNRKRWRMTRRRQLVENPMCQRCGSRIATDAHHVVDLKDGGDPYASENLASLCHVCHARVGRERQVAGDARAQREKSCGGV